MMIRSKLILGFAAMWLIAGSWGLLAYVQVDRIEGSVAVLSEITSPALVETMALVENAQRMRSVLSGPATAPDGYDVRRRLADITDESEDHLASLRALTARGAINIPIGRLEQTQHDFLETLDVTLSAMRREDAAAATARERGRRLDEARRSLKQVIAVVGNRAEGRFSEIEDESKVMVQTGVATVDGLAERLSEALTEAYPRVQAARKLVRYLDDGDVVDWAQKQPDADGLDDIEARTKSLLNTMNLLVHKLAGRLRDRQGREELAHMQQGFAQLQNMLFGAQGFFPAQRDVLAARLEIQTGRKALEDIDRAYFGILGEIEREVTALNQLTRQRTREGIDQARTRLTTSVVFGLFAAMILGWLFARRISVPLRQLAGHAAAIGQNGELRPLPQGAAARTDEVGILASSFNLMIAELAIARQRLIDWSEGEIAHMAHHDALTDLPNRTHLRQVMDPLMAHVHQGQPIAVLWLDLDRFKTVNDTLGHGVGDALLQAVAERLRGALGSADTVARLGGDEFVVVQVGADQPVGATGLAERLIEELERPFEIQGHHIVIGASVGISVGPHDGDDAENLLKNADLALYQAKRDGGGGYRFFEHEMNARMQARRALELELRRAAALGEFEAFYQPIVRLETRTLTGFEALVRWRHPQRGLVLPGEFIPLAEEIGLIGAIGAQVLKQACRDATKWPADLSIAVNLSPVQFKSGTLVLDVMAALGTSGLAPHRLELEITEAVLLQDTEATLDILSQLRAIGVRIAMDDFGTGYSSLSYLRKFPFDKIKIDRSFVRDLTDKPDSVAIVRAVAGLGRTLGITTTAEGVETEDQFSRLREEGCSEVQGYLFSKPRPLAELEPLIRELHACGPWITEGSGRSLAG